MPTHAEVASHVVRAAMHCHRMRDNIHYSRDMSLRWGGINNRVKLPRVPVYADCSSFITWLFHNARLAVRGTAGVDVVNNARWKHGYTGTMTANGHRHRFGTRFWKPGRTCVFYGRQGDIGHVALYVGKDSMGRKMVVSHGQESGPHYVPWNYRSDYVESRVYRI